MEGNSPSIDNHGSLSSGEQPANNGQQQANASSSAIATDGNNALGATKNQPTNNNMVITLDTIFESVKNNEHAWNKYTSATFMDQMLKHLGKTELKSRFNSIAIQHTPATNTNQLIGREKIQQSIESFVKEFVADSENTVDIRTSDYATILEFVDNLKKRNTLAKLYDSQVEYKDLILSQMTTIQDSPDLSFARKKLRRDPTMMLNLPNDNAINDSVLSINMSRAPVRCEILGVKRFIKLDIVQKILSQMAQNNTHAKFDNLRESRSAPNSSARTLMFQTNGYGLLALYRHFEAKLLYRDGKIKMDLKVYINCRPYVCRNCFHVGRHPKCTSGKLCSRCGSDKHDENKCQSRFKFCKNCKRPGHRAKDQNCQVYLRAVYAEVRRVDIPLEFLENEEKRAFLVAKIRI